MRRSGCPDLRAQNVATSLLSVLLSIDSDIIRHPEGRTTADHAVRQRFTAFLPDFLLPFGRLISVRSEVQLLAGPSQVNQGVSPPRPRALAGFFMSVQSVCTECAESRRGLQRTTTGDARRQRTSVKEGHTYLLSITLPIEMQSEQ
jgi:hypothetical protein